MAHKNLIGGEWRGSEDVLEVRFPYDDSLVGAVSMASAADMEDAVAAASEGFALTRKLAQLSPLGNFCRIWAAYCATVLTKLLRR